MMGPLDTIENLSDERFAREFQEVKSIFGRMTEGVTDQKSYESAKKKLSRWQFEADCRESDKAKQAAV